MAGGRDVVKVSSHPSSVLANPLRVLCLSPHHSVCPGFPMAGSQGCRELFCQGVSLVLRGLCGCMGSAALAQPGAGLLVTISLLFCKMLLLLHY